MSVWNAKDPPHPPPTPFDGHFAVGGDWTVGCGRWWITASDNDVLVFWLVSSFCERTLSISKNYSNLGRVEQQFQFDVISIKGLRWSRSAGDHFIIICFFFLKKKGNVEVADALCLSSTTLVLFDSLRALPVMIITVKTMISSTNYTLDIFFKMCFNLFLL